MCWEWKMRIHGHSQTVELLMGGKFKLQCIQCTEKILKESDLTVWLRKVLDSIVSTSLLSFLPRPPCLSTGWLRKKDLLPSTSGQSKSAVDHVTMIHVCKMPTHWNLVSDQTWVFQKWAHCLHQVKAGPVSGGGVNLKQGVWRKQIQRAGVNFRNGGLRIEHIEYIFVLKLILA